MVVWYRGQHVFPNDFTTVSLAFFNRYPNPYASHVISVDTISRDIDKQGRLHTVRLIKKSGKLPRWVKPLLGEISQSWIVEQSLVDVSTHSMSTYTRNLDHTQLLQVEEFNEYRYDVVQDATVVDSRVKFSSGFRLGIKHRVESWSKNKFDENIRHSRLGMAFVMNQLAKKQSRQRSATE